MIIDRLENYPRYFANPDVAPIFEFLLKLPATAEEKTYPIRGEDICARVMSHTTGLPEESNLEAHRQYIDIQMALVGTEGIDWYPLAGLPVKTPYDANKDVEFYERSGASSCRVKLIPGIFALLLPDDAHMPKLSVGDEPQHIKKVVVKVKVDVLFPGLARRRD